jgi:hypothetical protein
MLRQASRGGSTGGPGGSGFGCWAASFGLSASRLCHDSTGSLCQVSAGARSGCSAREFIGSVSPQSSSGSATAALGVGFVPPLVIDELVLDPGVITLVLGVLAAVLTMVLGDVARRTRADMDGLGALVGAVAGQGGSGWPDRRAG